VNNNLTPWGTIPQGTNLSPAWSWVLQHAECIERMAWLIVKNTPLDVEDARGALIADLAATFHKYDPERGQPGTYIWMRAQYIRRTMVRAGLRARTRVCELSDAEAISAEMPGSSFRMTARAEVALAFGRSGPNERLAMLSVVREWDATTVRRRLKCTKKARDAMIRSLDEEAG
jgi:hypothetical protein